MKTYLLFKRVISSDSPFSRVWLLVLFTLLFIGNLNSVAQDVFKQWDRTFGGPYARFEFSAMVASSDGGFLLGGSTAAGIGGDKSESKRGSGQGTDYWVVKVDDNGYKVWDRTFGGNKSDILTFIVATLDGGYLLGGYSNSDIGFDKSEPWRGRGGYYYDHDYWIVRIDGNGNKLWDKTFAGTSDDRLQASVTTSEGGFLLGGTSDSGIGADKSEDNRGNASDYWIIKIDGYGNKIWDRTYGGFSSGYGPYDSVTKNDVLADILSTSDGGFLIGGSTDSGKTTPQRPSDKSEDRRGMRDYWILKIDGSGNKMWDRTYGGTRIDNLTSLERTSDGFLLGGNSTSGIGYEKSESPAASGDIFHYWVVKIDNLGNKLWDRSFIKDRGELMRANYHNLSDLSNNPNGGFLLAGYFAYYTESGSTGLSDYWIVNINGNGEKIWEKTYGGNRIDILSAVVAVPNGYLLGGLSNSDISGDKSESSSIDFLQHGTDFWIIKLLEESPEPPIKKEQVITFDIIPDKIFGDEPFKLIGTASSGLPVSFSVISGPAIISNDSLILTGAGAVTVQASQEGDSDYLPAPNVNRTIIVAKAEQTINFEALEDKKLEDGPFNLLAEAISGLPVSFEIISGPAELEGNLITPTGIGEVQIQASQMGNENFLPAPDVLQSFNILPGDEGLSLQRFTLIKAATDEEVYQLEDGHVINLFDINTKEINIRAFTDPEITGSVKFTLSGHENYSHIENVEPYALFLNSGSDFFSWKPALGSYHLIATPYSERNGKGAMGRSLEISFTIIDEDFNIELLKVTLINAINNEELYELENENIINLKEIGTKEINFRAYTSPKIVDKVHFQLIGDDFYYSNIEFNEPYTTFRNNGNDYFSWKAIPGDYELHITMYSEHDIYILYTSFLVSIIDGDNTENASSFKVFPNPGSNLLNFHFNNLNEENLQIQIFDLGGNEVLSRNSFPSREGNVSLDVSGLKNNSYIIKVMASNGVKSFRWIKEK